ncbi:hypothetical protein WJX72_011121 [[Myrmecia] bisecta]|uniref:Uncharacterized protein n=1 Tax=[Myrmecia] bisecta TaxID=41462 RepID=A0AAW1QC06_9CHLO
MHVSAEAKRLWRASANLGSRMTDATATKSYKSAVESAPPYRTSTPAAGSSQTITTLQPVTAPGAPGAPGGSGSKKHFGFLKLDGLQHFLRMRTAVQVNEKLSAEFGADFNVTKQTLHPRAALSYELFAKGRELGTLRATTEGLLLRKRFNLAYKKVSASVYVNGGFTYDGRPEGGVDVADLKPPALVVAAAVGLLLLGKPVSGSRSLGCVNFGVPFLNGEGAAKPEAKVMVSRDGRGLSLSLKQLNGVLRL